MPDLGLLLQLGVRAAGSRRILVLFLLGVRAAGSRRILVGDDGDGDGASNDDGEDNDIDDRCYC